MAATSAGEVELQVESGTALGSTGAPGAIPRGNSLEDQAGRIAKPARVRLNSVSRVLKPGETAVTPAQDPDNKLGLISGVFVPTLQNILGIILFLRLPWITGQAGIGSALAVVLMGCFATTLTSLSMSALATNGVPAAGGCYSIIKSSLGLEFGGTVGILLFMANTFGIAMYTLGFTEVVLDLFFDDPQPRVQYMRLIGAAVLAMLFIIVYVGISYISKAAKLFLTGVLLAILSIYCGVLASSAPSKDPSDGAEIPGFSVENFNSNFGPDYDSKKYSFAVMLSIFFPAVTDPLAGSNYSGDLRNPQQSIPPGTLAAVLVTTAVFCLQVILIGGSVSRAELLDDYLIVTRVAWPFPYFAYAGMLLSTLGAGLQSLAGAPRLLGSIASDDLIPILHRLKPLPKLNAEGVDVGEKQEPRRAIILCAVLSGACVMIGDLNAVAPFITMWFLTCYAIINGACALLAYEGSPHFRPTWRYFDWRTSLLGAIACTVMMFFINWYAALGALFLAAVVYKYIERQPKDMHTVQGAAGGAVADQGPALVREGAAGAATNWRAGMRFDQARSSLLALEDGDVKFKYWRPFILCICDLDEGDRVEDPRGLLHLVQQMLRKARGLAIFSGVATGDYHGTIGRVVPAREALRSHLQELQVEGFSDVIAAPSKVDGIRFLIHAKGLGVLRPNTVLLPWPQSFRNDAHMEEFSLTVQDVAAAEKTLLLFLGKSPFPEASSIARAGTLDVWWVFKLFPANGLLLLLPYLLQQHPAWRKSTIRLFVVATPDENLESLTVRVERMLKSGGLRLEVHVKSLEDVDVPRYSPNDVMPEYTGYQRSKLTPLMAECSGNSDLVVITLPRRGEHQSSRDWVNSVESLAQPLERTLFVQETGKEQIQFFNV